MYQHTPMFIIVNTLVALLRGINVGGRNRVPMADLCETFTSLGFERVETVIQSGNVCFDADGDLHTPELESDLCSTIAAAIATRFEVRSPVLIRTDTQFATAVEAHPFVPGEFDSKYHHIMFLASPPGREAHSIADLSPQDRHLMIGREIHVLYTSGSARSKFTVANVERRLGVMATARNLPTCHKILDLLGA